MKMRMGKLGGLVLAAALLMTPAAVRAASAAQSPTPAPTRESAATVVVFNNLDPASVNLAAYYAKRRGIPIDRLIGLECPRTEEITRAQYDETIASPLRKVFAERGWWHVPPEEGMPVSDNQIRFVALIRGIPLKIASVPDYPGDSAKGVLPLLSSNAAAVDSELATLGIRTRRISGPLKNLYYKSFTPFLDMPFAPMMLVCRLDGPTVETVRHMIDGAIEAEQNGLNGFAYVDLRGISQGPMAMGDTWLATAAVGLRQYGMPVIWDNAPDLIPEDFPMDHAAIYLGWYAGSVAGPMARDDFRFEPGAIAVHIHSFSAATLRDAKANWAAPLLAHGAAATIGNVYEPYLALTPNLDLFADRLRNGLTFAESAYASEPVLSWMTTFVGDPLYRPFQGVPNETEEKPAIEYAAYKKGARTWFEKGRTEGTQALQASARRLQSGIVWEGLGLLQWSVLYYDPALESFQEAGKCYGKTEDGLRTVLHQAEILKVEGKMDQARSLAANSLERYKGFHGIVLLRAIIGLPAPDSGK